MPRDPELPSARVLADIRRRLQAGEWQPGEQLPATRALAEEYGVSSRTVVKVLALLADDGLVRVVASWGTFAL